MLIISMKIPGDQVKKNDIPDYFFSGIARLYWMAFAKMVFVFNSSNIKHWQIYILIIFILFSFQGNEIIQKLQTELRSVKSRVSIPFTFIINFWQPLSSHLILEKRTKNRSGCMLA